MPWRNDAGAVGADGDGAAVGDHCAVAVGHDADAALPMVIRPLLEITGFADADPKSKMAIPAA